MNKVNILEVKVDLNDDKNTIYPVIIEGEGEMILVDCGYPNFLSVIEQEAINREIDMKKLSKIIITHHDLDHMGSLAAFKRKYPSIKVVASINDEEYINGSKKSLRLQQAESIYDSLPEGEKESAKTFHSILESIEPCNVDICVKDKDFFDCCGGIEIISTPGHMPGHISIYIKSSKTLIAGDALVFENDELTIANPQYTLDMNAAKKSIVKLLDYEIDSIICYHGGICNKDIKNSLRKIVLS